MAQIFVREINILGSASGCERPRPLFPFRKRSLPVLTVDAVIGNQAFSHGRSNICSGLMYNKATNTFLNSLRKNKD